MGGALSTVPTGDMAACDVVPLDTLELLTYDPLVGQSGSEGPFIMPKFNWMTSVAGRLAAGSMGCTLFTVICFIMPPFSAPAMPEQSLPCCLSECVAGDPQSNPHPWLPLELEQASDKLWSESLSTMPHASPTECRTFESSPAASATQLSERFGADELTVVIGFVVGTVAEAKPEGSGTISPTMPSFSADRPSIEFAITSNIRRKRFGVITRPAHFRNQVGTESDLLRTRSRMFSRAARCVRSSSQAIIFVVQHAATKWFFGFLYTS
eukprot:scpid57861/ scgid26029/ 